MLSYFITLSYALIHIDLYICFDVHYLFLFFTLLHLLCYSSLWTHGITHSHYIHHPITCQRAEEKSPGLAIPLVHIVGRDKRCLGVLGRIWKNKRNDLLPNQPSNSSPSTLSCMTDATPSNMMLIYNQQMRTKSHRMIPSQQTHNLTRTFHTCFK